VYVVTMASQKGGAGKSTLSILLAAMFAHANLRCVLVDCDAGQHTVMAWAAQRPGREPAVLAVEGSAALEAACVEAGRRRADFCLVDTPAGIADVTTAAVARSDLVLIPTKCDVTDRWAVRNTVSTVARTGRRFLVVPTEVPARRLGLAASDLRRLRHDLADIEAHVWTGQISERRVISYDLAEGRVPSETDWRGPTNQECVALWRRMMEILQAGRPLTAGA